MPGGRLYLTNKRLIWQPSPFARRVQKLNDVVIPLLEIEKVDVPRRMWTLAVGGTRRRMRVRMRNGEEQFFMLTMGGVRKYAAKLAIQVGSAA